jgi:hypothetical protein
LQEHSEHAKKFTSLEITILFLQHAITKNFVQENRKQKNNNVQHQKKSHGKTPRRGRM